MHGERGGGEMEQNRWGASKGTHVVTHEETLHEELSVQWVGFVANR